MIRINLLPHREEARRARRQQFYVLVVLMLIMGGVIALAMHTAIQVQIDEQQSNNDFLKSEVARLDTEIVEIKRLKEQTQALLSRKQVIELLQSHRAETVHIFNELARLVPEGVYLRSLKQTGLKINLTGYAQSNARVSTLMRNLDGSPALEKPELIEIKTAEVNKRRVSDFNLNVAVRRQSEADAKKVPGANQSGTPDASAPVAGGASAPVAGGSAPAASASVPPSAPAASAPGGKKS